MGRFTRMGHSLMTPVVKHDDQGFVARPRSLIRLDLGIYQHQRCHVATLFGQHRHF